MPFLDPVSVPKLKPCSWMGLVGGECRAVDTGAYRGERVRGTPGGVGEGPVPTGTSGSGILSLSLPCPAPAGPRKGV